MKMAAVYDTPPSNSRTTTMRMVTFSWKKHVLNVKQDVSQLNKWQILSSRILDQNYFTDRELKTYPDHRRGRRWYAHGRMAHQWSCWCTHYEKVTVVHLHESIVCPLCVCLKSHSRLCPSWNNHDWWALLCKVRPSTPWILHSHCELPLTWHCCSNPFTSFWSQGHSY